MGVVYKVRHLLLQNNNIFALKILHPKFTEQSTFQARFLREVEMAMGLTHANIVQLRDFGTMEKNLLFYTMDFFAGPSLKGLIRKHKRLPPERVVDIACQILRALAEAHKAKIIHRDLKPDNILIGTADDGSDCVRILDFGIAKMLAEGVEAAGSDLTQGAVLGTPKYMSPEQTEADRVDGRSDLYSLGCIVYEMLTGQPPFHKGGMRTILMAHLTAQPPPLAQACPELQAPAHLESLVYHLLEKDREVRPASAEKVLEMLATEGRTAIAPRTVVRKRGKLAKVVVSSAAAVTVVAAGLYLQSHYLGNSAAARTTSEAPTHEHASTRPGADAGPASRLSCAVCGSTYLDGEKIGGMCHGEPLRGVGE
jgi:serine/threonine-protein kinase